MHLVKLVMSICVYVLCHFCVCVIFVADGSKLVFDRDLSLEVRHSDDQDTNLGTLLTIKVKVLVLVSHRRNVN